MRQAYRSAPWYRSMLFVPGNHSDWMLKAPKYGADALILDLEDAVPVEEKPAARDAVRSALIELSSEPIGRFVRLNGWHTGNTLRDLLAIVGPGLDGVMLSKTEDTEDVQAVDLVLTDLEIERGLPVGRIEIMPLCETALSMYRHFEICLCSERVRRTRGPGGAVPGGDSVRSIGLHLSTDEGPENLIVKGRSGLEARAAGVMQVLGGMTNKLDDLDLVRRLAIIAKNHGATGSMAIHPSHVPILNEVFGPSPEEVADARATLQAMAGGIASGAAAVRHNGVMVDYAQVRTSLEFLEQARAFGVDVGEIPDVEVLSFG